MVMWPGAAPKLLPRILKRPPGSAGLGYVVEICGAGAVAAENVFSWAL